MQQRSKPNWRRVSWEAFQSNTTMNSHRPDRHRAIVAGIAYHQSFAAMVIGGVHDHVLLPPSLALEAIQFLKGSSSKWINETNSTNALFARQEGYAAFSVSLF